MYGPLKPVSACFVAKNRHVDYFIKIKKIKLKKCFFSLEHSVLVGLVALTKSLVYLYLNISALPVPFGKWVWCVGSVLRLLMHNL